MQNSIWKLTALAGVIGLGFLIVLQMQGEIGQNQQAKSPATTPLESHSNESAPPINPEELALSEPPVQDQWEPQDDDPAFGTEPESEIDFPATASTSLSGDPFSEPPAFLSEPVNEPAVNELPDSAPLLAGTQDFGGEPARLPTLNEPPPFQLMSAEELVDPFESATEASAEPLPEPAATLPDPEPLLDLPKAEKPTGLFDSLPDLKGEPEAALSEPEVSAPSFDGLPLPEAGKPEPLPALDLPNIETPPTAGLFDDLPASDEPLPEQPRLADETYLVEPELKSEPLPLTPDETEPLPLPETLPLVAEPQSEPEALPELKPQPTAPAATVPEQSPVLTSSTGEVITELTGDAELPAELPASAQQPELTIEKVAPKEATLGKPMIYSIIVSNRGATNAAQVIVEDQVPKGCRLVGTIPQAELIGSKLLWRLGHLAAGSKKKILVKVIPVEEGQVGSIATVNFIAEVAAKTDVRPTASAGGDAAVGGDAPLGSDAEAIRDAQAGGGAAESGTAQAGSDAVGGGTTAGLPATMPVKPSEAAKPQINLSVSGPDKASVGDTVVLKFNIRNEGPSPARDVALQDIIPAGFEHPAGKDLTYEVGFLDPGKSVDVELELVAVKPGTHTNQAVITAAGNLRAESKKNVEVADTRGLTLKVETSDARPIGEPSILRLVVTNESSQSVSGATLTATLPAKSHFVSASEDGQFDKASRTIHWSLPVIAAGAVTTVAAQVTPLDFGVQTASATLSQAGRGDLSADAVIEALGVAALKLDLENVPPTAVTGEEFNVDLTVRNRGNGADSEVVLALLLPEGVEFVNARGPVKPGSPQVETAGSRVSFTAIPEIGEQASVDFQVTLRARSAGRHKLRAQISSKQLTAPLATDAAIVVLNSGS
jgi:uncharacterized repeat protein (TIGR01451 family)